jgi:hypothetical protein
VEETNRYARHVKSVESIEGGPKWTDITVACLKAFIVVHIYMGMKREPHIKAYWHREGFIFHCPIISNIMTQERFYENGRDSVRLGDVFKSLIPPRMNILRRINQDMIKCGKFDG